MFFAVEENSYMFVLLNLNREIFSHQQYFTSLENERIHILGTNATEEILTCSSDFVPLLNNFHISESANSLLNTMTDLH